MESRRAGPGGHPEYVFTLTLDCLPKRMAEGWEQRGLWEEAPAVGVGEDDGGSQRALSGWEGGSQETKLPFYPHMVMFVPPMPSGDTGTTQPSWSSSDQKKVKL